MKQRFTGHLVLPIEALVTAAICRLFGLEFINSAGLVAIIVVTDVAHIIRRGLQDVGNGTAAAIINAIAIHVEKKTAGEKVTE
jgi:hypothetical protein